MTIVYHKIYEYNEITQSSTYAYNWFHKFSNRDTRELYWAIESTFNMADELKLLLSFYTTNFLSAQQNCRSTRFCLEMNETPVTSVGGRMEAYWQNTWVSCIWFVIIWKVPLHLHCNFGIAKRDNYQVNIGSSLEKAGRLTQRLLSGWIKAVHTWLAFLSDRIYKSHEACLYPNC